MLSKQCIFSAFWQLQGSNIHVLKPLKSWIIHCLWGNRCEVCWLLTINVKNIIWFVEYNSKSSKLSPLIFQSPGMTFSHYILRLWVHFSHKLDLSYQFSAQNRNPQQWFLKFTLFFFRWIFSSASSSCSGFYIIKILVFVVLSQFSQIA